MKPQKKTDMPIHGTTVGTPPYIYQRPVAWDLELGVCHLLLFTTWALLLWRWAVRWADRRRPPPLPPVKVATAAGWLKDYHGRN